MSPISRAVSGTLDSVWVALSPVILGSYRRRLGDDVTIRPGSLLDDEDDYHDGRDGEDCKRPARRSTHCMTGRQQARRAHVSAVPSRQQQDDRDLRAEPAGGEPSALHGHGDAEDPDERERGRGEEPVHPHRSRQFAILRRGARMRSRQSRQHRAAREQSREEDRDGDEVDAQKGLVRDDGRLAPCACRDVVSPAAGALTARVMTVTSTYHARRSPRGEKCRVPHNRAG